MKIIHCSDIHLDSALGHNFSAAQAKARHAELCAAFARMVQYAVREHVDAVLIAGDLFDNSYATVQTVGFVLAQMRTARDVSFFYLRGNHDGGRDALDGYELPDNLKVFADAWTSYRCGDALITGIELTRENWDTYYATLELPENGINIVLLHGQISTQSGPELIALPKLRNKHIDYLALGHIHSCQKGKLDERGIYCYSGCLEGRGFDECGEKGFVLLEADDRGLRSSFVPFAGRNLHEICVDITDAETVTQILARMEQAAAGICADDLVKFILQGSYTLQTQKDLVFLQKMLAPQFYLVKIKDESRLELERESYEFDASLKGEFIRMVLASDRSEAEKERMISCGIRALNGEEVTL